MYCWQDCCVALQLVAQVAPWQQCSQFSSLLLVLLPPLPLLRPQDPKACSVVLRGASKDVLNEVERNLHDAMGVARNVCIGGCQLSRGPAGMGE